MRENRRIHHPKPDHRRENENQNHLPISKSETPPKASDVKKSEIENVSKADIHGDEFEETETEKITENNDKSHEKCVEIHDLHVEDGTQSDDGDMDDPNEGQSETSNMFHEDELSQSQIEEKDDEDIPTMKKYKKKKEGGYIFSDDQEAELAEWYQQHPLFYNKKLKDYKNMQKKQRLFEEKATEMDWPCTGKFIYKIFYY